MTCDAYVVAGSTDHIVPWTGAYQTTQLLGGQCEFVLSTSGHIQAIVNPPTNPKASYLTRPETVAAQTRRSGWRAPSVTPGAGGSTGRTGWLHGRARNGRRRDTGQPGPSAPRTGTGPLCAPLVIGTTTTPRHGSPQEDRFLTFVRLDGHLVRVSVKGEGRPLLLVMGLGGNIEMWDPLERALNARGIQTIAYDASGTGDSPPRWCPAADARPGPPGRPCPRHARPPRGRRARGLIRGRRRPGALAGQPPPGPPPRARLHHVRDRRGARQPAGPLAPGHAAALLLAGLPPAHRRRRLRADGRRSRAPAGPDQRPAGPAPKPLGVLRAAGGGRRLDEPSLAAPDRSADPGAGRRLGPHRPGRSTPASWPPASPTPTRSGARRRPPAAAWTTPNSAPS